uniref:GUN4-like domain-containing protein n=1 Tax=Caloglossa intermedia TaxID=100879 RepID=A0A1Z1M6H3_9FLOR|nr:hypothetical protein [Caloglossa intermedia]ARW61365.1 hypothetical protein [Caloglossa intermedia]
MQKINNKFNGKIKSNFDINEENVANMTVQYIDSVTSDNLELQKYLLNFLIKKIVDKSDQTSVLEYSIFNKLKNIKHMQDKLNKVFPNGITEFRYYLDTKYKELNNALKEKKFQKADEITKNYLIQLAQENIKVKRKWLYFTDIHSIPPYDLFFIDLLWKIYSNSRFGFSVQRNIWLSCNKNWGIFLEKINWNQENKIKRYPDEFTWNTSATKGHLPLFNQIRGNQAFLSLLEHHAWIIYDC